MKIISITAAEKYQEDALLLSLSNGDPEAFKTIYKKYFKELYFYARKTISAREDCEELVQDIFESLWNRRNEVKIDNLSAYLFTSLRYKVIRFLQKHETKRKFEDHYRLFEVPYIKSEVVLSEDLSVAKNMISDLPLRYRNVMQLKVFEDLTNKEIALKLQLPKTTVENYVSKALKHLKVSYLKAYRR